MSYPEEAWHRLGRMLVARRVAIDPSWHNRQRFVQATGLNERLVSDLEKGRRPAYRDSTIHAVEAAYQLPSGAIYRALDTGDENAFPPVAGQLSAHSADPGTPSRAVHIPPDVDLDILPAWQQAVWMLPGLSVEERRTVLLVIRLYRDDLKDIDALLSLKDSVDEVIARELRRINDGKAG